MRRTSSSAPVNHRGRRAVPGRGHQTRTPPHRRRDVHGRFARRSRSTRRRSRTVRRLPERDALGRFLPAGSFVEISPWPPVGASVVREASRRSRPSRPIVKRRWWRAEGPQDPELPKGYAYGDETGQ